MGYVDKLEPVRMGRLRPAEGETLAARKRLGVAARLSERRLEIRQMKGEVYFWLRRPLAPMPRAPDGHGQAFWSLRLVRSIACRDDGHVKTHNPIVQKEILLDMPIRRVSLSRENVRD